MSSPAITPKRREILRTMINAEFYIMGTAFVKEPIFKINTVENTATLSMENFNFILVESGQLYGTEFIKRNCIVTMLENRMLEIDQYNKGLKTYRGWHHVIKLRLSRYGKEIAQKIKEKENGSKS